MEVRWREYSTAQCYTLNTKRAVEALPAVELDTDVESVDGGSQWSASSGSDQSLSS